MVKINTAAIDISLCGTTIAILIYVYLPLLSTLTKRGGVMCAGGWQRYWREFSLDPGSSGEYGDKEDRLTRGMYVLMIALSIISISLNTK